MSKEWCEEGGEKCGIEGVGLWRCKEGVKSGGSEGVSKLKWKERRKSSNYQAREGEMVQPDEMIIKDH